MCAGMTTQGHKCRHRARLGSTFCKKHRLQKSHDSLEMNNLSASSGGKLKRKFGENNALEKFSSSNASNSDELGLITEYETSIQETLIPIAVGETLDERNCLMRESELYNALPTPVSVAAPDFPRCIGYYGQSNSEQCLENAKRHTLYCEKHFPKFLNRARNGMSRLVSKDVFINLLKKCSSRKQKLYLHHACELFYGFMKKSLSRQMPFCRDDIMDWTLSEASKDLNVGEYLLKLVSCEREKIMKFWGFGTDKGKDTISSGFNAVVIHENDHNSETTIKCKICAAELADDKLLGAHWTDNHKKEAQWLFRGYACTVCMSSFTNRKVLESHVKDIHGVQFLEHSLLFQCMSCNSHFVNPELLWQHVLSFHMAKFGMTDHSQQNSMNQPDQPKLWKSNDLSVNEDDCQKYICRFCGLKFDLLPDLGRHHQVAHMNPSSVNQFRGNHYIKHNRHCHPRFKKIFGGAFRFKKQTSYGMQKQFLSSNLVLSLRPKLKSQASETIALGRLLESHCADVAETLFSEMQKTKPRPSNIEILSIVRSACCKISLHNELETKYGVLHENFYLKAAKLCSELNIKIGWHVEGFICSKGCKPLMTPPCLASKKVVPDGILDPPTPSIEFANDTKWEMEECHYVLDPKKFNWKATQKTIVLCEDVSFGKERVPVACVVDEDLKDTLNINQEPPALMPWQGFTYITKRLLELSLGLDAENSQLGCACPSSLSVSPRNVIMFTFLTMIMKMLKIFTVHQCLVDFLTMKRAELYWRYNNVGCSYLYVINAHVGQGGLTEGMLPHVIDATKLGNVSRFINHSCSPNLVNYLVLVESMDCQLAHIGLYASRDIARGEELAYDYCYEPLSEGGCPCHCEAPNCRGHLY